VIFIHSTILESENCRTVDTMRRRNETKRDDMIIDMQCSIAIHLMYIYTYIIGICTCTGGFLPVLPRRNKEYSNGPIWLCRTVPLLQDS